MSAIEPFAQNLWTIDGPNVRDLGVTFTTRMTVAKLANGPLWLESPVPLAFATIQGIALLGQIRYLVSTTPRHVWRLDSWHTLFPEAQIWAPRSSLLTLNKAHLTFTGILGDEPLPDWAADFDQIAFQGNPLGEEIFFLHKPSRTAILGDFIQVHPVKKGRPLRNALLRLGGVAAPDGGVGIDIRLTFTNRALARRSLDKLLSWDFDKLIIAHGPCIKEDAKPFVERAFRWLRKN